MAALRFAMPVSFMLVMSSERRRGPTKPERYLSTFRAGNSHLQGAAR